MPRSLTIGRTLDHCRRHKLEVVGNCACSPGQHQPIDLAELPAAFGPYTIDELHRRRVFTCDGCGRMFRSVLVFGFYWGLRSGLEEWPLGKAGHVRPINSDGVTA